MRVTPEQYYTFFNIVVILILCFFAFVGFRIMLMKQRWKEPPPRRKAQSPGTGESAGTFGTSGIGASDMSTSMDSVSSSDSGSDTGASGASGGWND